MTENGEWEANAGFGGVVLARRAGEEGDPTQSGEVRESGY